MMNYLRLAERTALVALFLTMSILFAWSVIAREVGGSFASGFAWIEEAVRYMNAFLVFLGLGLALERGKHVGIDTFRDQLGPGARKLILKLTDAVGFMFSAYMAWLAFGLASFVLGTGQSSPTLGIRTGYVYLAPAIGFVLLGLRYGLSFLGAIDRFSKPETPEVEM